MLMFTVVEKIYTTANPVDLLHSGLLLRRRYDLSACMVLRQTASEEFGIGDRALETTIQCATIHFSQQKKLLRVYSERDLSRYYSQAHVRSYCPASFQYRIRYTIGWR